MLMVDGEDWKGGIAEMSQDTAVMFVVPWRNGVWSENRSFINARCLARKKKREK